MTLLLRSFPKKRLFQLGCLVATGFVAGCASIDVKSNYKPPQQPTINSSISVNKPFDQAWNDFVRNLATSFFTVNTISKESRLINISLNKGRSNNFLDCGKVSYKINDKDWTFNPARNSSFKDGGFRSETIVEHKVTGRRGRMNIFVAPKGAVTVFEILGQVIDRDYLPESQASFEFTTKIPDTQPLRGVDITCQATGQWEQLILDLARGG
jgi:hypothetical protein